jgi:tyrosyl-tRNA synthetase
VGITEAPNEMFGKLMSISDNLMWSYLELLTDRSVSVIRSLQQNVEAGTTHPKQVKVSLASEIVRDFWGEQAALQAAAHFQRVFSDRQAPEEIKEIKLTRAPGGLRASSQTSPSSWRSDFFAYASNRVKWSSVLGWLEQMSVSEIERVIKQRGFEINGQTVTDPAAKLNTDDPASYELRLGKKKFLRIVIE